MSNIADQFPDDAIAQFLRTRSADPELGLLDDIVRTAGATPQDRPWLGLRPILLPRRTLLIVAGALLLATMGAITIGSRLMQPDLPSGTMWPQASLEEVQEAQKLADAGDPDYAWQVDPELAAEANVPDAEIVARFLREELGWEEFVFNPFVPWEESFSNLTYMSFSNLTFIRCASGGTNPLYPLYPNDFLAGGCAPTIDELRYETVSLDLSQPGVRGRSGIWVVSRWAITAPFAQTDPHGAETEVTARLDEFLAARIAGEGAEGYVKVGGDEGMTTLDEVPLLYATTSGAPYERFEIERVSGPRWPYAEMEFTIRLFADGDATVVEQPIAWTDVGGARLELTSNVRETTENGQPVGVPYEFFGGEVTASALAPWEVSPLFDVALTLDGQLGDERIQLKNDPLSVATGCEEGPVPADANALAANIQARPDLEATALVAVTIGGIQATSMDITVAPGASVCPLVLAGASFSAVRLDQGSRMRLYLVDMPEGSTTRILAIAIVAPEARFESVIEAATPVLDSVEFHAP